MFLLLLAQPTQEKLGTKKVPVFRDFLSYLLFFYNNTLLLKSRPGLKVVVKVKECVAAFHFVFVALR